MAHTLQVQFEKVVDWFAMQLGDEEKKRLVTIYHLPKKYYEEYPIIVFQGLKMTGVFGYENPEGLLDIADLLERKDLLESTKPKLKELKKQKELRKTSTVVDLKMLYSAVDIGPAFEIAMKQIEVAQASSELLQRICKYRFRDEPEKKNVLCDRLKEVIKRLDDASDLLTLMGEDAMEQKQTILIDQKEFPPILKDGANNPHTLLQRRLNGSCDVHTQECHIYEDVQIEIPIQKEKTRAVIPKVLIQTVGGKTAPPTPLPKPKQKHQLLHHQQQTNVKLDPEGYALLTKPNTLPVQSKSTENSGTGTGDSGIGEWPFLKVELASQRREYQSLIDADKTSMNESSPRPTTLPKPKTNMKK